MLPEFPQSAKIYVENKPEIELIKKAEQIRQGINFDLLDFWHNNKFTLEEKQNKTLEIYGEFDEQEKMILSKDAEFALKRLQWILIKYFEAIFPKSSREPLLRVSWFFNEMDKLALAKFIEDSEWHHNRNEDELEFDDFKWWDNLESKLKETFPDGVFSAKSYEKTEEMSDEILSRLMRQYWQAHPKEFDRLVKKLENP